MQREQTENWTSTTQAAISNAQYILVVDDEPSFCTVVSEILRSYGYLVRQAYSVEQALEILDQEQPDLIVTDVMMPGIDGLTFIREVRLDPIWSSIPTIVVSAKGQPEDIAATKEAGANACLVKPFSARLLLDTVRAFLNSDLLAS
jgi:CheY-like chemotaxis protein